jgi:hypothetical protein
MSTTTALSQEKKPLDANGRWGGCAFASVAAGPSSLTCPLIRVMRGRVSSTSQDTMQQRSKNHIIKNTALALHSRSQATCCVHLHWGLGKPYRHTLGSSPDGLHVNTM